ncbi:MAG: hypothetical protein HOW73_25715 [Polyangiaceae bacterium]|nr:hypothetical protein [Polyangiaceae bacterium]
MTLADDIAALPDDMKRRLSERGFREERLFAWAKGIGQAKDERNRYKGVVTAPRPGDVSDAPEPGTAEHARYYAKGLEALRAGKVALCVLAGGMATRMGGVVKALVEAVPGKTFLDLRLGEQAATERLSGRKVPLWLMVSEATRDGIASALGPRLDGDHIALFEQCVSLRLAPDGSLFHDDDGVSVYATGHGDLPEALAQSGLLKRFLDSRGDGYVWIANLDNLGATVDPAILGWHMEHPNAVTVEVVDKVGTDRGGVPVVLDGRRIISEEFRLPKDVDPTTIRVFNTNTFVVDARALADLDFEFTFVEVDKNVGGKKAVQFERLLGEFTVPLEPSFLRVPRDGKESRFLPVKDNDELERRRGEIQTIAEARGMLA